MRLGVDFGTTHTVVSACDRGNYPVVGFTTPSGDLIQTYPSLIAARGAELRFGLDALAALEATAETARSAEDDWVSVRSFKRWLSSPGIALETRVPVGTVEVALIDVLTGFLEALRNDILHASNVPVAQSANERFETAIATPANAFSPQRLITLEAFRRAGFSVTTGLDEPSASGIEYAQRYARAITARRQRVLVYDLGGGTFDASLVDMAGTEHRVLATSGIARLGGDDFDEALVAMVLERQGCAAEALPPGELDALRLACCEQKERLNANSRRLTVETSTGPVQVLVDEYYDRVAPLIDRTLAAVARTLEYGSTTAAELSGVYVVGGASALPPIGRALRAVYGRQYHRSPHPSASAAIGLAIANDEHSPYLLRPSYSRNLGVFREVEGGAAVSFDPVLDAETLAAAGSRGEVHVVRRYRPSHNIGHFRFVECAEVDDLGTPRGDLAPCADVRFPFAPEIREVPARELERIAVVPLAGQAPLIEERYRVGAAGEVSVDIVDLDADYVRHYELGSLSRNA